MCKHKEVNLRFDVRHDKFELVLRTMKNVVVELSRDKMLASFRIHVGPMHEIRIKEGNFVILE